MTGRRVYSPTVICARSRSSPDEPVGASAVVTAVLNSISSPCTVFLIGNKLRDETVGTPSELFERPIFPPVFLPSELGKASDGSVVAFGIDGTLRAGASHPVGSTDSQTLRALGVDREVETTAVIDVSVRVSDFEHHRRSRTFGYRSEQALLRGIPSRPAF